jgi:hypothetical protein
VQAKTESNFSEAIGPPLNGGATGKLLPARHPIGIGSD